ncbi:50S ribosomal protein L23 [Candidatus Parcubacteria bacterium]|nr:50S ribosomal protein L23 [Candidatus Parcubacteria bacterium]
MSLFGKKTRINDSSAEKAEATKGALAKKQSAKASAKAVALPKAEKKAEEKSKSQNEKRAAAAQGVSFPKGSAVIKPRITEKAGLLSQKGVYTFDVQISANSKQIAAAIADAYKVTPVRVSVAPIKSKTMFARGKAGKTVAGKKAYVYLKKGETIEFI